ncbi:Kinesin-2 [Daldinia childiae]|uniref:Kinesin-2 n=1 Tax=Daldinia childiae TaxID=326645 RepID=UPI001445A9C3|nr:Kinesin-2 [Daldinia childiae]KAF3065285.1 Kinesin-2 [Daldinia childiae]
MDPSIIEDRLARVEERARNLEKIILISTETQAAIWKNVPEEFDRSRELILKLLEKSHDVTNSNQNQSLTRYVGPPQNSDETGSYETESFINTYQDVESYNATSYNIENFDDARYKAEIEDIEVKYKADIEKIEAKYKAEIEDNEARYKADIEDMKAELLKTEEMRIELLEKTENYNRVRKLLDEERRKSRALVGTLRDIQGNIRVLCRIRPAGKDTPEEDLVDFGPQESGEFSSHWGKMTIATTRSNYMGDIVPDTPKVYNFERIFSTSDTNKDVFEHISDLVESSMEGQKIIMFAYGQTGAGKTFTLSHKGPDAKHNGVIPRSLDLLFKTQRKLADEFEFTISVSIQEIYQNKTFDLLGAVEARRRGSEVRANSARKQSLHSHEESMSVIDAAMNYRVVSATDMNAASSRSHLILTFEITRVSRGNAREVRSGFLNIVDLAGSERPNAMGSTNEVREQGIQINRSLMSLTKLISCIATGDPVVYDTELVRSLRPALSPQTKVVMFVMISPLKEDQEVSFQTLERGREASAAKMASADLSGNAKTPGPSTRNTQRGDSPSRGTLSSRGGQSSTSRGGQGRGRR